jgi:threonine dehydratase
VPTITRDDIARTAAALRGVAVRTPLVESAELTRRFGAAVWVKCEQHQPIGAFKIRGAYTAISRLAPEERARGIITHSSGNHGQAVAYVAKHFGVRAVIVMPESAPAIKVEGIRRLGAEIVFTTRKEREARAQALIEREGLVLVPPYDHVDVIMGQATCAWEILEAHPEVGTIVSPVGGGGMIAGTCAAVSARGDASRVAVYAVEPAVSPKLTAALEAGRPVPFEPVETIADGLVPPAVGRLTFAYIQPVLRGAIALTEAEIATGVRFLFHSMGLKVEPSGATPVAALLSGKLVPQGPAALILTGGNVDPALFARLAGTTG